MGYWFPIDDATLENGCLWYVPGSHKLCSPVKRQFIRNPMFFEQQINVVANVDELEEEKEQMLIFEGEPYVEFPEEEWVAAPVNKGIHTKIIFSCNYIRHYSYDNITSLRTNKLI